MNSNSNNRKATYFSIDVHGKHPKVDPGATILDGVYLIGEVEIEEGANVWFGSVLRGDIAPIKIGKGTNVQESTVIHVSLGIPCIVGEDVTVGHRALLHACTVNKGALIGMGAVVLDGAVVGEEAVVGAGAVVSPGTIIPPRTLVVGIPAKVKRTLQEGELEQLRHSSPLYRGYASDLKDSPVEEISLEPVRQLNR